MRVARYSAGRIVLEHQPEDGWQERVAEAVNLNPDRTSAQVLEAVDRCGPFADMADDVLRAWARHEGGERDAGGEG